MTRFLCYSNTMAPEKSLPQKSFPDGKFEPYVSEKAAALDEEYVCAQKGRTDLMKQVCEEKDHLMANALRSSENYRELMKYTDDMQFKDEKAVVLYPASGFHVAPIAEMGEQLLGKHKLKEVEFIYTEIGGMPILRNLQRSLYGLIQRKDGWSTGPSYKLDCDIKPEKGAKTKEDIKMAESIKKGGGSFEQVLEINTPRGIIRIRYKNALSGKDYYLDEDLQRADFLIVHDIYEPVPGNKKAERGFVEGMREFVGEAVKKKVASGNADNFMVIAEDFTRPPARTGIKPVNYADAVAHTEYPYGCTAEKGRFETRFLLPVLPSRGIKVPNIEPIDIGEMGFIDPKILPKLLDLAKANYTTRIFPSASKIRVSVNWHDAAESRKKMPSFYLAKSELLRSWNNNPKKVDLDKEKMEAENVLSQRLITYLGIPGVTKEDFGISIGIDKSKRYFIEAFDLPKKAYDEKVFGKLFGALSDRDTHVWYQFTNVENKEPVWGGAIIIKPHNIDQDQELEIMPGQQPEWVR